MDHPFRRPSTPLVGLLIFSLCWIALFVFFVVLIAHRSYRLWAILKFMCNKTIIHPFGNHRALAKWRKEGKKKNKACSPVRILIEKKERIFLSLRQVTHRQLVFSLLLGFNSSLWAPPSPRGMFHYVCLFIKQVFCVFF